VAELTDLMDCSPGVRTHVSSAGREHPHPGAQLSLFDTSEGFRHTCFITNASALNFDAAALELRHRGHARVEDRVRCWKDCGLQNLPFASFTQNLTWVATSLIAGALIAWAQMICLRRRAQGGRAEDSPLPDPACCRSPRAARPTAPSCAWTRPGRGLKRSGGPS